MKYVIRIEGLVTGGVTGADGQYIVAYDPSPRGLDANGRPWQMGEVFLETSKDPRLAKMYENQMEAMHAYRAIDTRNPVRQDGKPNRPLTAFSVTIMPVADAVVLIDAADLPDADDVDWAELARESTPILWNDPKPEEK